MSQLEPILSAGLVGFFSGFLISMPVGPVNLTIVNEGTQRGFLHAALISLGQTQAGAGDVEAAEATYRRVTGMEDSLSDEQRSELSPGARGQVALTWENLGELARKANLTLVGRAKGKRFVALAGSERLVFDADLEGKWERAMEKLGFSPAMLSGDAGHA